MSIRWVTAFIDLPAAEAETAEAFWQELTMSGLSSRRGPDGEFATLLPTHGDAYLRFQRVREGDGGSHLDLHIDLRARSLADVAARAIVLGATVRQVEDGLTVLDSPGGFGFCLVPWAGEATVPDPVQLDSGGPNRLDQLCLDIPPDRYDDECSFWAELTGWALQSGSLPEFRYLERPAGIAIRLLLQRRATADEHDRVTGHVDFACADREALAQRHLDAGARLVARYPSWITLADPAGRQYCVTRRLPA
jgi:hypothetical protein